jgi:hypothetical protein
MTSLREAWQTAAPHDSRKTVGPPPASAPVEMNVGHPVSRLAQQQHHPQQQQQQRFLVPATHNEWMGVNDQVPSVETLDLLKQAQQEQTGSLLYSMQTIISDTEAYLQQRINQIKKSVEQVQRDQADRPTPASKKDVQIVLFLSCLTLVLILVLFGVGLFMQRNDFRSLQASFKNLTLKQIKVEGLHDLLNTGMP